MNNEIGYRKEYKMRVLVQGAKHISVAIPYVVIERQAAMREITVEEFLAQFVAVAEFNSFEGVHYTFKELEGVKC